MDALTIGGVCERDVDLLLLEEFTSTPAFVEWFAREIGIEGSLTFATAARSVTTANGESDLELALHSDGALIKVLVENKVDAGFQPRQAERYSERAASYIAQEVCARAVTVIVAPISYFPEDAGNYGFDRRVTYESLVGWFERSPELGARATYKRALLAAAITRGGLGWQLVRDDNTTAFWEEYWKLASSEAPELRMPRPQAKPTTSSFIRFSPTGLPDDVELIHKVRHGNVDLQLEGRGDRVFEFQQQYGPALEPGMRFERAGKSAALRIQVPAIDTDRDFLDSKSAARDGLRAAAQLLSWYRRVVR